ncbi:hypothetical protein [Allomesorhizobium alhagi]|uniref:Uncharacterized protein n=1 Tax=Mesorhizobium alhagi CCNWXJ12-2 TaxID=1107882 RepID=H0HQB7_9HYPH|nr:hypothetical protein [Mesorhizobium alhagi]EHK57089.1 hypothetical protein MAXJ12_11737 [Mesorhizobium alhagi CCNWXJ12-2]
MRARRILAIAAASGKVGFVYFSGGDLHDWGLSAKASRGIDQAFNQAKAWLTYYRPDLLIIEYVDEGTRKGKHTRSLIEAVKGAANELNINCVGVVRRSRFPNKYVEAAALVQEFPQIEPWLPKPRKIWEPEPRNIIYFEALALAKEWLAARQTGQGSAGGEN